MDSSIIEVLVTGNFDADIVAAHMIEPFRRYQHKLEQREGIRLTFRGVLSLADLQRQLMTTHADIAFLTTDWHKSPDNIAQCLAQARRQHPDLKLIYLDYLDYSSSPNFNVLPYVDRYVKKQLYRDMANYRQPYQGGFVFEDYCARHYHYSSTRRMGSIPLPDQLDKIVLGWNLVTFDRLYKLWRYAPIIRALAPRKDIDINCRIEAGETATCYYEHHRRHCLKILQEMQLQYHEKYRIITNRNNRRINYLRFNHELARSRIGVSPFGWGEIAYRDFECIINGALLIKPDMDHLTTFPDIYKPYETYIPIKWDLSDLEEKCLYYLEHPAATRRITAHAKRQLDAYFNSNAEYRRITDLVTHTMTQSKESP